MALAKAEALRYNGEPQEALDVLDSLSGAVEQTAEYLYQRAATVAALGGNPSEVVALLERAVEADGSHAGALFGLALENDRRGNDDYARELYERAAAQFPTHVGTLFNLGVLYEDIAAVRAGPAVLPADPRRLSRSSAGAAVLQGRRRLARHVLRRGSPPPAGPAGSQCSAFRSPTSSCRSAAAIACRRWAS